MIPIFLGYDKREAVGFHVCVSSIIRHSSQPVAITPISGDARDGTNAFIYARYTIPRLMGYEGWALFADGSDMLFRDDVAKLCSKVDDAYAVMCVQRDYKTRHPRKYLGTAMESDNRDYRRKNWSSVMLMNCGHPANRVLTDEYIAAFGGAYLHGFGWLGDGDIGLLPPEWNVLIGEEGEDAPDCSLAHFTLGVPCITAYENCRYADEWRSERSAVFASPA